MPLATVACLLAAVAVTAAGNGADGQAGEARDPISRLLDSIAFANPPPASAPNVVNSTDEYVRIQLVGSFQEEYPYLSDAPARWSTEGDESPTNRGQ